MYMYIFIGKFICLNYNYPSMKYVDSEGPGNNYFGSRGRHFKRPSVTYRIIHFESMPNNLLDAIIKLCLLFINYPQFHGRLSSVFLLGSTQHEMKSLKPPTTLDITVLL